MIDPAPVRPVPPAEVNTRPCVAIVGAGFSGLLTALRLLTAADGPNVRLIERRGAFARGAAYSTVDPGHLLNVRAANMSAFAEDPQHFVRWLAAEGGGASAFVRRSLYGDYLQAMIKTALEASAAGRLRLEPDEAVGAERVAGTGPWRVTLAMGRAIEADVLVLAVGNRAPDVPPGFAAAAAASPAYRGDPWSLDEASLPEAGDALLIGTGLSMVDVALHLARVRPRLALTALSRRGLLPRRHLAEGPAPAARAMPEAPTVLGLLRALRREAEGREADGRDADDRDADDRDADDRDADDRDADDRDAAGAPDWRAAFDGLRPHVQAIWRGWPLHERRRFLRHARPWWDVHRHRLAPPVAERLDHLTASGALRIEAGRIARAAVEGRTLRISWRPRGGTEERYLDAALVVNCAGPNGNLAEADDPLLRALFAAGRIRADDCRLGLDVDPEGRLIGADGAADGTLYAVGPLTRGAFWEITSVPDIRLQAAAHAAAILAALKAR